MQKTFLSSAGAKTNRLVHKTKQQHSQQQALFFSPSQLLFLVFSSCRSQWQIHSKFKSGASLCFLTQRAGFLVPPHELAFLCRQTLLGCQSSCSKSFLSVVSHCCLKTSFRFQQILVCLREVYLVTSLFSKLAYLVSFYF